MWGYAFQNRKVVAAWSMALCTRRDLVWTESQTVNLGSLYCSFVSRETPRWRKDPARQPWKTGENSGGILGRTLSGAACRRICYTRCAVHSRHSHLCCNPKPYTGATEREQGKKPTLNSRLYRFPRSNQKQEHPTLRGQDKGEGTGLLQPVKPNPKRTYFFNKS